MSDASWEKTDRGYRAELFNGDIVLEVVEKGKNFVKAKIDIGDSEFRLDSVYMSLVDAMQQAEIKLAEIVVDEVVKLSQNSLHKLTLVVDVEE